MLTSMFVFWMVFPPVLISPPIGGWSLWFVVVGDPKLVGVVGWLATSLASFAGRGTRFPSFLPAHLWKVTRVAVIVVVVVAVAVVVVVMKIAFGTINVIVTFIIIVVFVRVIVAVGIVKAVVCVIWFSVVSVNTVLLVIGAVVVIKAFFVEETYYVVKKLVVVRILWNRIAIWFFPVGVVMIT